MQLVVAAAGCALAGWLNATVVGEKGVAVLGASQCLAQQRRGHHLGVWLATGRAVASVLVRDFLGCPSARGC